MTSPQIELRNASRWYGNNVAVNAVSCEITSGITGLLGPNGAGKSTIMNMIAGLLTPSSGEVLIGGTPAAGHPSIYRSIGMVPEGEQVHSFLTGLEFVTMNARLQGLADPARAAADAIARVDMTAAAGRLVGTYSKGMRQRIKVAGATVHDPSILLLDEPFNGMDPRQRGQMEEVLRARADAGSVILISSHILEELQELASSILVMVSGRLAASGGVREIRRRMTNRPHTFVIRSSDDRALASRLMSERSVFGVELAAGDAPALTIRTSDRGTFARTLTVVARQAGVRLFELRPTDESLESVFEYLVQT